MLRQIVVDSLAFASMLGCAGACTIETAYPMDVETCEALMLADSRYDSGTIISEKPLTIAFSREGLRGTAVCKDGEMIATIIHGVE